MIKLNVYLNFPKDSEKALNFYKEALGGTVNVQYYRDMPDKTNLPEEALDKVLHGALVSNDIVIMASDLVEGFGPPVVYGNNFTLSIQNNNLDEAKKVFELLSQGGKVIMPLEKTFWGAIYGQFIDKFGINWMVNCEEV